MSPSLTFWWSATFLFLAIIFLMISGWWSIRTGNIYQHQRAMKTAGLLIVVFLVSYCCKVIFLGKEDLSAWPLGSLVILWIHESLVTIMLLTYISSYILSRKFRRGVEGQRADRWRRWHRNLGKVGMVAGLLALFFAGGVLFNLIRFDPSGSTARSIEGTPGENRSSSLLRGAPGTDAF